MRKQKVIFKATLFRDHRKTRGNNNHQRARAAFNVTLSFLLLLLQVVISSQTVSDCSPPPSEFLFNVRWVVEKNLFMQEPVST